MRHWASKSSFGKTFTHERQQLPSPPMKHKNEEANNENRNTHCTEAAEQKEENDPNTEITSQIRNKANKEARVLNNEPEETWTDVVRRHQKRNSEKGHRNTG